MSYLNFIFIAFIVYVVLFLIVIMIVHFKIFNKRIDYVNTGELFSEIEQKTVSFKNYKENSDCNLRVGTFYYPENKEKKHLILLVCGYEESYLDFKSEIFFWLKNGYTVFCYDVRGTGRSQGRKIGGFTQFLKDCLLSIEYIEKNETFKKISLVGHSMGGFAVATSLQFKTNIIDNSVIISGFDYPSEFVRKSVTNSSFIFTWPIEISIKLIEFLKFGNLSFFGSVNSINIFNKPILIIQSVNDKVVKINNSIYNKKRMITNKNVEYILLANSDHNPTKDEYGGLNMDLMNKINEFIGNNQY